MLFFLSRLLFSLGCLFTALCAYAESQENLIEFPLLKDSKTETWFTIEKYDPEVYELAYAIFLANHDVQSAYAIAVAAVGQAPTNITWREKLAQVAIWNGAPHIALNQYQYLAEITKNNQALDKAVQLARLMHDQENLQKLLFFTLTHEQFNIQTLEEYLKIASKMGEPDNIFAILKQFRAKIAPTFYLNSLAKTYQLMNRPDLQFKILQTYQTQFGTTPEIALQLAIYYINHHHLDSAFNALEAAKMLAAPENIFFWKTYSRIALLLNKNAEVFYANHILAQQKNPGEEVYNQLANESYYTNPLTAYAYATKGYALYPKSTNLARLSLSLAVSLNKWQDFGPLLESLPQSLYPILKYDDSYWKMAARYWQQNGEPLKALDYYAQGIKHTDSDELRADYLAFLEKNNDIENLTLALNQDKAHILHSPKLWAVAAAGYAQLHEENMTRVLLQQFYQQFNTYAHDPYWMIAFKDALENAHFPVESQQVAAYAWPLYQQILAQQTTPLDFDQMINYVKLSLSQAPTDANAQALAFLQSIPTPDVALLSLSWALQNQSFELAQSLYQYYEKIGVTPPAWTLLSIALYQENRYQLRDILAKPPEKLANKDKSLAAEKIGALSIAQDAAYDSLKENPQDKIAYDNFTTLFFKTASQFYSSEEFYQYASAEGPRNITYFTYFITPSIGLTPYNNNWMPRNLPTTTANTTNSAVSQSIVNLPHHDERVGLKVKMIQIRGDLTIDMGYRNNLNGFTYLQLLKQYQVSADLSLLGALSLHQEANESLPLLVGGMKNKLSLDVNYTWDSKNYIRGEMTQNFFYTQGKEHVGDGTQSTLIYEHKFWRSYSDWSLMTYGTAAQYYHKANNLSGSILTLVPEGAPENANFLVPINFVEYGITASVGQSYKEEYTHSWKPFLLGTLSYNTVVGPGKLFSLGIAGMVFGRDHLMIFYERGTNQGTGIQLSRTLKSSYHIYF